MTAFIIVAIPLALVFAALVVAWRRQRKVDYTVVFGEPQDDPYDLGLRSWDHDCYDDTSEEKSDA